MNSTIQNPGTLPPGMYYVGDLCYLPKELVGDWNDLVEMFHPTDGPDVTGIFEHKDGKKFANFNTFYGDGLYYDEDDDAYYVDSGSIGCFPVESHSQIKDLDGHTVVFEEEFTCQYYEDGTIRFGYVEIYTGYNDSEGQWMDIEEEELGPVIETEASEVS